MFDRFTDDARKAMSYARMAAERFNHDHIGVEHMLIGLLTESSGESAAMFEKLGIDHKQLLSSVEKGMKPSQDTVMTGQLPFTLRGKRVLERSIAEARKMDHNYVGVEHLLLALLCEVDSPVVEAFQNCNVAYADVREKILAFLGRDTSGKITTPDTTSLYNVTASLETLLAGHSLSAQTATELMQAIIAGNVGAPSIAALAVALRAKGESIEELAAFARVMRGAAVHVDAPVETVDTCGTGGDGSGTFNISTAAALVAAGMGIKIAKHGGRSASSLSGSADVLRELGVRIDVNADCVARCIKSAGIGFMFAPAHHPGMKAVAPVRRELGIKTFFNLLGPLSNPAHARQQLIGVYEPSLCEKFAQVLHMLGSQSALIVCGAGPGGKGHLDEISTFGPTSMARLSGGQIELIRFDAAELGIPVADPAALAAANAAESAAIIRSILDGKKGAPRNIVALNAGAVAIVTGKAREWREALALAEQSIDSGPAKRALEKLVVETNG